MILHKNSAPLDQVPQKVGPILPMSRGLLLLALVLGLCSADPRLRYDCGEPTPIVSITVIQSSHSNALCPPGFDKHSQDMNRGAGGDYIFLCSTRGDRGYGSPLTSLTVSSGFVSFFSTQDPQEREGKE
jgi:hypothetical protein